MADNTKGTDNEHENIRTFQNILSNENSFQVVSLPIQIVNDVLSSPTSTIFTIQSTSSSHSCKEEVN